MTLREVKKIAKNLPKDLHPCCFRSLLPLQGIESRTMERLSELIDDESETGRAFLAGMVHACGGVPEVFTAALIKVAADELFEDCKRMAGEGGLPPMHNELRKQLGLG